MKFPRVTLRPSLHKRPAQAWARQQKLARSRLRRLIVEGLENRWLLAGDLTIDSLDDLNCDGVTCSYFAGFDAVARSRVVVAANLNTNGKNLHIEADEIYVDPGVVIDTSSLTQKAGDIRFEAEQIIFLSDGSKLLANGSDDSLDGHVLLHAKNQMDMTGIYALNQLQNVLKWFDSQTARIVVGSAVQIDAGDVTIESESGNKLGEKIADVEDVLRPIVEVFLKFNNLGGLFQVPIAAQFWKPESTIKFHSSTLETETIHGSGTVTIHADATAEALAKAVWSHTKRYENGGSWIAAAVGEVVNAAESTIVVEPGVKIFSDKEIYLGTSVDNIAHLTTKALQNNGVARTYSDGTSFTYAGSRLRSTSKIDLQEGSWLESKGTVKAEATAVDENSVSAIASVYRDGLTSLGFAWAYSASVVQVIADGTIHSGALPEAARPPQQRVFNPAFAVDFEQSKLRFPDPVPYLQGERITFDSLDGTSIPGLMPGETYYVILDSEDPNALQLAPSKLDAAEGNPIQFGVGYPTLGLGDYRIPITFIDSVYSNAILFTFDKLPDGVTPAFQEGMEVEYRPIAGQGIGISDSQGKRLGDLPVGTYKVHLIDSPEPSLFKTAIQLVDSMGQTMLLNPRSYVQTDDGTIYEIASIDGDSSTFDFRFESPVALEDGTQPLPVPNQSIELVNGQPVLFRKGISSRFENLNDQTRYYAVVDPAQPGVIRLAESLDQAKAANPAIQDAVPVFETVENQSAIVTVTDSFEHPLFHRTWYQPEVDGSYSIWNNALEGTFRITVQSPKGEKETGELAWNATPQQFQAELEKVEGIEAKVTGAGTSDSPWRVELRYLLELGAVGESQGLVFNDNPLFRDGSPLLYHGIVGKPIGDLVPGLVYHAFHEVNPFLNEDDPQYILTLRQSEDKNSDPASVDITQSMTDAWGRRYEFQYFSAETDSFGFFLEIPTTIESIDGASLVGGSAQMEALATDAVQLYSIADEGTFVVQLTSSDGREVVTAPLPFDIDAVGLQNAIHQAGLESVSVTGVGSMTSPFVILGLAEVELSIDSDALRFRGKPISMVVDEISGAWQRVWTTADEGDFRLQIQAEGVHFTTALISSQATAEEIQAAIVEAGSWGEGSSLRAEVRGGGTTDNPWWISLWYQPLRNGDALVFHDAWDNYSMGMVDGETYYAVLSANQNDPSRVLFQLARSETEALASAPIVVQTSNYLVLKSDEYGVMVGSTMGLTSEQSDPSGIVLRAELEASDSAGMSSLVGLFSQLSFWVKAAHRRQILDGNNPGIPEADGEKKKLELSAAVAWVHSINDVGVIVGSHAELKTPATITLESSISHSIHTYSASTVARKDNPGQVDGQDQVYFNLAGSLAYSKVENQSRVRVDANAKMDAGEAIDMTSEVDYPMLRAEWWKRFKESWWDGSSIGSGADSIIEDVSRVFFTVGFGTTGWLFNHWANAAVADGAERNGKSIAVATSWVVTHIDNVSEVVVEDGVLINQSSLSNGNLGVSIDATTNLDQFAGSGQTFVGFNATWLAYSVQTWDRGRGIGSLWQNVFGLNSSSYGIGASVNDTTITNKTQATLGGHDAARNPSGPLRIEYGMGGLEIGSQTTSSVHALTQSGGAYPKFGLEASLSDIKVPSQETKSRILNGPSTAGWNPVIAARSGTVGSITLRADDETSLYPWAGNILFSQKATLGYSGGFARLDRDVIAAIGEAAASDANGPNITAAGNVLVTASAGGYLNPIAVAGSFIRDADQDIPNGEWGFGISGDYSHVHVDDVVSALVQNAVLDGADGKSIEVLATNDTRTLLLGAQAVFKFSGRGTERSFGFGGSAGYVDYQSDVLAKIERSGIDDFAVTVKALNSKPIVVITGGLDGSAVRRTALEIWGSVAINHVVNTTKAVVSDVHMISPDEGKVANVTVQAIDADQVTAIAGIVELAVQFGGVAAGGGFKLGFGGSWAENEIETTTQASIERSDLTSKGNIEVLASGVLQSWVISGGVELVISRGQGVALFGMSSRNRHEKSIVQAWLGESQVIVEAGDLKVHANHLPLMFTLAGDLAIAISKSGRDFSIGLGASYGYVVVAGECKAWIEKCTKIDLWTGDLEVISTLGGNPEEIEGLDELLESRNLGGAKGFHLYSMAIAGGVNIAVKGTLDAAVGIVGAWIDSKTEIKTKAYITNSNCTLSRDGANVTVAATEELKIRSDSGGAEFDFGIATNNGTGVAVGLLGAIARHHRKNAVVAYLEESHLSADGTVLVEAAGRSNVHLSSWGVAFLLAGGQTNAVAIGDSVGVAEIYGQKDSEDSEINLISATIRGGTLGARDGVGRIPSAVRVRAIDETEYQTNIFAGGISSAWTAGAGSASVAAHFTESISRIYPEHQVIATIEAATTETGSIQTSEVQSDGSVEVLAENKQVLTAHAWGVDITIAVTFSGNGFSSAVTGVWTAGEIISRNILVAEVKEGSKIDSATEDPEVVAPIRVDVRSESGVTLSSNMNDVAVSVGLNFSAAWLASVAVSIGWIGVTVHNHDSVDASVSGSTIHSAGGDVAVVAKAANQYDSHLFIDSSAVAIFAFGFAFAISEATDEGVVTSTLDGSKIDTGRPDNTTTYLPANRGRLTLEANTKSSLQSHTRPMAGGALGLELVGAKSHQLGKTTVRIENGNDLTVGDLWILSESNPITIADGRGLSIGGVSVGTEQREVEVGEIITLTIDGGRRSWNVSGDLVIHAGSDATSSADTSQDQTNSDNTAGWGILAYTRLRHRSDSRPKVDLELKNAALTVGGSVDIHSYASLTNSALARNVSVNLVGYGSANAQSDNSPSITLTTEQLDLTASGPVSIVAGNTTTFTVLADSGEGGIVGGAGAYSTNHANADVTFALGRGTAIDSGGSVYLLGANTVIQRGGGHGVDQDAFMTRCGGGGLIEFSSCGVDTQMSLGVGLDLASDVQVTALGGDLVIGAGVGLDAEQFSYMKKIDFFGYSQNRSKLFPYLDATVSLGDRVELNAPKGKIDIGTNLVSNALAESQAVIGNIFTYSQEHAWIDQEANQSIEIGSGAKLHASDDIRVLTGYDPVTDQGAILNAFAIVSNKSNGLGAPDTKDGDFQWDATVDATSSVSLHEDAELISRRDVYLGAREVDAEAVAFKAVYWLGMLQEKTTESKTDGATVSRSVSIDGKVIAGAASDLRIQVSPDGDQVTVNETFYSFPEAGDANQRRIIPPEAQEFTRNDFIPFQLTAYEDYNPTTLLEGLSPSVQSLIASSISSTPVRAMRVENLFAPGGKVVIHGDRLDPASHGSIEAHRPDIRLENSSNRYLLLGDMTASNSLGMGEILWVLKNTTRPDNLSITEDSGKSRIEVIQTAPGPVGDSQSGPAVALLDDISNISGVVEISNLYGSFIQKGVIDAETVTIEVPSGSYSVSLPDDYFGSAGSVMDYWTDYRTQTGGFFPGLDRATAEYDANYAAAVAANVLYGNQSGKTDSHSFSDWLYNINGNHARANHNVRNGNVGTNYPNHPRDNYNSTQNGQGIFFFGSAIPYLWSITTIASGSNQLTNWNGALLGFLDYESKSNEYSRQAGGDTSNGSLNVTQGTGPQNASFSAKRGVYPLVPYIDRYAKNDHRVVRPGEPSLEGLIQAGSLSVTARYIDINGPIQVGKDPVDLMVVLGTDLQMFLDAYQTQFESGGVAASVSIDTYLGGNGITGHYDAASKRIVIDPVTQVSGKAIAVFDGGIISTNEHGKVIVISDPGKVSIENQTSFPLSFGGMMTSSEQPTGIVEFHDTLNYMATAYVYHGNQAVQKYTGEYGDTLDQMRLETTLNGATASHLPKTDATLQWVTEATISRQLRFENTNEIYKLFDSSVDDRWMWGGLSETNKQVRVSEDPFQSRDSLDANRPEAPDTEKLQLNAGEPFLSTAYWNPDRVQLDRNFEVQFTYVASGDRSGDGIALVFQTEGSQAVGGSGGALGYVGIANPKAAYQINLFSSKTVGSAFVLGDNSGPYQSTGGVSFKSGNPIRVVLQYDAAAGTIREVLTDSVTKVVFTRTHTGVPLAQAVGASAYLGFTASTGFSTAIHTVQDFQLLTDVTSGFSGWIRAGYATPGTAQELTLTDGTFNHATAYWHPEKIMLPSRGVMEFQFVYRASGNKSADGVTLAFQKSGTAAVGSSGGSLGYVGITGPTAAYQINLYMGGSTLGSRFVTNNRVGGYQGTGDVFFNSGNPIEVRLVFDADSQTLSENLFDTVTLKSFQRVYSGIDLRAVLGAEAYIGFTGSVGGASSIQKVSQFQVKEGVSKGFREAVDSTTLLDGFSDWMQVGHITSHSSDQLTVTDGTSSTATAYWNPEPISIASEGKVRVQFTYQASGNKAGDGLAMVFQTQGVAAIGSNGGSLGYVGIGGPTAAYLINLNDASGRIAGSNFVTTNASGNYSSTEWVRFKDGNPISVRLEFDLAGKTLTETLVDTVTNQTYQKVHPAVDLHGLFGSSNVYVGFTGATGGTTAVQKASHFLLESRQSDASTIWKRPIRLGSPYAPSGTVIFENNPEYRESIVATVTQSATATTTFSSDFKSAWDFGPNTTWHWSYPTEIQLQLTRWLPANHAISIDFSGVRYGNLDLASTQSSLHLDGTIRLPGDVALEGQLGIAQSPGAKIVASSLHLESQSGAIGSAEEPLAIDIDSRNAVSALAGTGIHLTADQDFIVGSLHSLEGPVVLEVGRHIVSGGSTAKIEAAQIDLRAPLGSIGSQDSRVNIQGVSSQNEFGALIGGLLYAEAQDAIYLHQASGELRLGVVKTAAPLGVVSIINDLGSITDGSMADAFQLRHDHLPSDAASNILKSLKRLTVDQSAAEIEAFENSVTSAYHSYWDILGNSSLVDGVQVLSDDGVAAYQTATNSSNGYHYQNGFDDWLAVGGVIDNRGNLLLNDTPEHSVAAVWGPQAYQLPQEGNFQFDFTYQASGSRTANGITFTLQTVGTSAIGQGGPGLGYAGLGGAAVAYQIGVNPTTGRGSNFVVGATVGPFQDTGDVQFDSGNPIRVRLNYDGVAKTLHESLYDTVSGARFERTYSDVDLEAILGASVFIGFTGSDQQGGSPQSISSFGMNRDASREQVQAYVDAQWTKSIDLLQDDLAFGPNYSDLVIFSSYDSTYEFHASDAAKQDIVERSGTILNLRALLALTALNVASTATPAVAVSPVIQTTFLELQAGGSIGSQGQEIEIAIQDFEDGTLTPLQQAYLSQATESGSMTMIGTDANGARVAYRHGAKPLGVTTTAVLVQLNRPILVDLTDTGILLVESGGRIGLVETRGSMQVLSASAESGLSLVAQGGLQQGVLQASTLESGWSLNTEGQLGYRVAGGVWEPTSWSAFRPIVEGSISRGALSLLAGGDLGASGRPLIVSGTGQVDVVGMADAWLSTPVALHIGQWRLGGDLHLDTAPSMPVYDALASSRSSFTGFGPAGNLWVSEAAHGSVEVITVEQDDRLNMTLESVVGASSLWPSYAVYQQSEPISLLGEFVLGFHLQSASVGTRFAVELGNDEQPGVALVLDYGDSLDGSAWGEILESGQIQSATTGQSLGSLQLNSNHLLRVVLHYSPETLTLTATIMDTVTGESIVIRKANLDLVQRLGGHVGKIAFSVYGDGLGGKTHAIRGFHWIDGPVNLDAASLQARVGSFGVLANPAASVDQSPILLSLGGPLNIVSEAAVVAEQVVGDLQVDSIISPTTIQLSAPFGAIVNTSGNGSGEEGENRTSGILAPVVGLTVASGMGSAESMLLVQAAELEARSVFSDIFVQHRPLEGFSQALIRYLSAAGAVYFQTSGDLSVIELLAGASANLSSYVAGNRIHLPITGLHSHFGGPLNFYLGGFQSLELDGSQSTQSHDVEVGRGEIDAGSVKIAIGSVQELSLKLGDSDDKLSVQDASGLLALNIDGQDGHDSVSLANAALRIPAINVRGHDGDDALNLDLRSTGVWVMAGKVETAHGVIHLSSIKQLLLDRLEQFTDPGAVAQLMVLAEEFLSDRLLVVGTTGGDSVAVQSGSTRLMIRATWGGALTESRTFGPEEVRDVEFYLLGGDDFLSVIGSHPIQVGIHGGRGDDWMFVQSVSSKITDLYGSNVVTTGGSDDWIHLGSGNDEIDAGTGKNVILDEGGINTIQTGSDDDWIEHASANDWIDAKGGINRIWLNGKLQGWHNSKIATDVNRDGRVSPLDMILAINKINLEGIHAFQGSADSLSPLFDVNADGMLTPIDLLLVLNTLNKGVVPPADGEGEGEALRWGKDNLGEASTIASTSDLQTPAAQAVDVCFTDLDAMEAMWMEPDAGEELRQRRRVQRLAR